MEWLGKLIDMVMGGLPGAVTAAIPAHLKKQWLERAGDLNPFKSIGANHDLVRATRLAWIEAAQEILEAAEQSSAPGERRTVSTFNSLVATRLVQARDLALDRRLDAGNSPIDAHIDAVINGVPELVSPGEHADIGRQVTDGFVAALAAFGGWPVYEVPRIYGQLADQGLPTLGSGRRRSFGELVFAAFAEIIKDPAKYPEAREAFYIAMDQLGREIGRSTLAGVQGLDSKLDRLLEGVDALQVLRVGASRHLNLLPDIARDTAATRAVVDEIKRQQDELVASLRDQARDFGIKEGMLIALARRYAEGSPGNFEAALVGLERALEVARDERERGRLPSNISSAVDAVIARIDALNETGDLRGGQAALDQELARLDAEDERRRAARSRLYEKGIAQAILTRDVGNARRFALARLDLDLPPDPDEQYRRRRAIFIEWYQRGSEKGLNFDLEVAIALARDALSRADTIDHRGAMRTNLGIALRTLGARESGTTRLEEAVAAYRAALEEHTRERVPLQWAATQNNLGNALWRLGERESGTARLEEAVAAYRAALEEYTRERVPLQWALTQNNLAGALQTLGERESGTARLEEAVAACRAALEERTRERVPLDWAMTQTALGNALSRLGERENGTARLEEAVAAYRAALEERTRERVPLQWAATQNNLGHALQTLGERESGTARLEEAVATYRAALEEYTRERVPLDWAMTQSNLGYALWRIGERESGTARLEEAVAAYRAALEERTRERVPLQCAMTQNNLGNALSRLGERESGTARLEEAIAAYRAALEELTRERVPLQWAMTQSNLAGALQTLGARESGTARLEEAVTAYRAALEERTRERVPLDWAATQKNLEAALDEIERRQRI